jgi:hypothetical protein
MVLLHQSYYYYYYYYTVLWKNYHSTEVLTFAELFCICDGVAVPWILQLRGHFSCCQPWVTVGIQLLVSLETHQSSSCPTASANCGANVAVNRATNCDRHRGRPRLLLPYTSVHGLKG